MGLRINTNTSSLDALRNLHMSDRAQQRSLERLSSGLRINRGADDPSGLVISERLRSQISALEQDSRNSQNGANLISTADASLQKVSDLLIEIQRSVQFALSSGSATPEQIAAEQDSVDQAVEAIDRIAATTRFGDREILNGSAAYTLTGVGNLQALAGTAVRGFNDINMRSVHFSGTNTTKSLSLTVTQNAQHAQVRLFGVTGTAVTGATLKITGNRGSAQITVSAGATNVAISDAINAVADQTGVFAQNNGSPGDVVLTSETVGSAASATLQVVSGGLTTTGNVATRANGDTTTTFSTVVAAAGNFTGTASDSGLDAIVSFNGMAYTGVGASFSINTADASFDFKLNSDLFDPTQSGLAFAALPNVVAGTATATISVKRTGLEFQLREGNTASDRMAVSIASARAADLGTNTVRDVVGMASAGSFATAILSGGFLSSLKSGQGNDLTVNAANAQTIVDASAASVAKVRGFLGAVVGFNLEPNIDSIEVATQNLSSSLSSLRDLDFAEETANFTRTQILFQSGIASLAAARTIPQAVLQLLGG